MGLGKTPIAIASAEELFEQNKISCCLIVCPASLKYQWAEKLVQFTDCTSTELKVGKQSIVVPTIDYCAIIDGDKDRRGKYYELAADYNSRYIIIGYDNVLTDYPTVAKIKAEMVVLDEATAIKSFKAQRSKRIKKLLRAPYRLALSGTPVENKPDELFSIMQWVDDTVLGRYDLFEKAYINRNKYGWVVSYKNLPVLRKKVAPSIARLTADDDQVSRFMPGLEERQWSVKADKETNDLYVLIAEDMLTEMDRLAPFIDFDITSYYQGMDESQASGKLMAMYTCLDLLADHPDLIVWSAKQYQNDKKGGSKYAYQLWQSGVIDDILFSPKLEALWYKIKELNADKVLIYSKYRHMLDIIQHMFPASVQHHGGMSPVKKAEATARFRNDPDCMFFLSSHAGAYGLDMNMSKILINFDLPWSAGRLDQINSRHRRRSSEYDKVYVYDLVLKNSFEERRLRILDRKKRLGSSILDGHGEDKSGKIILEGDSLRKHLTEVTQHGILDRSN